MKLGRLIVVTSLMGLAVGLVPWPATATSGSGTEVSVGSNDSLFSQNKQNEPAVAVDPAHPTLLVAGANDNIDLEACNAGADNTCPFTAGVGTTGVYFSFDGGGTWHQPTYSGYSARSCLGTAGVATDTCSPLTPDQGGRIGTLPWYFENGIVSDGDPALAFGPTPSSNGGFSWSNGSRLYFGNLSSSISAKRSEAGFKGVEAIGVSRLDIPADGISSVPVKDDWKQPVPVTASGSAAGFADKDQVWADNAASSPYFGNAYVCFGDYVGGPSAGSNAVREVVARSTDGGDSWRSLVVHKNTSSSSGHNQSLLSGTSGCTIRTDSSGTVYVFWVGYDSQTKDQGLYMARSFSGGASFETARRLVTVQGTGVLDPVQGRNVMDGVAGARDDLSNAPSVDIANNSPTGAGATDRLVLNWVDGSDGLNNEHTMFTMSTDGGGSWTDPRSIEVSGDRPYYSAVAISPDGLDAYVVYNAFTQPFQPTTGTPRPLIGVLLHASLNTAAGVAGPFSEIASSRADPGDARASSANALSGEFLGDYVYATARNDYVAAVFNDTRDGADCPAIDAWREFLQTGTGAVAQPAPALDCTPDGGHVFGASSIYGFFVPDPS
ncbi:MAG: hypothetical protein M3P11_11075 [Actinomycetota bacterium]|nr:hypothetical protein [Actinomycetota bacterium]